MGTLDLPSALKANRHKLFGLTIAAAAARDP